MVLVAPEKPSTGRTTVSPAAVQGPSLGNCQTQIYWTRDVERTDEDTRKGKSYGDFSSYVVTFASRWATHCVTMKHLVSTGVVNCKAL